MEFAHIKKQNKTTKKPNQTKQKKPSHTNAIAEIFH